MKGFSKLINLGVQSNGVGTSVKHFPANNQEATAHRCHHSLDIDVAESHMSTNRLFIPDNQINTLKR